MAKDFLAELKDHLAPSTEQLAQNNLNIAARSDQDPTTFGQNMDIGRKAGMGPTGVDGLPRLLKEDISRREQRQIAVRDSQALQNFLAADPKHALVSFRDVEKLQRVASVSQRVASKTNEQQSLTARIAATAAAVPVGLAEGLGQLSRSAYGIMQWNLETNRAAFDLLGFEPSETYFATKDFIQRNLDVASSLPESLHVAITDDDFDTAEQIMAEIRKNEFKPIFDVG